MNLGLGLSLDLPQSSAFSSPIVVPNLALWLRSDIGVTADVNGVNRWADQSGNGQDFVQAVDANKPALIANAFGAFPAIRGNADGARFLANTGFAMGTSATYIFVCTRSTLASTYLVEGTAGGNFNAVLSHFGSNAIEWFDNAGADRITFAATPAAGLHVLAVTSTHGGPLNIYFDSTSIAATKASPHDIGPIHYLMGLDSGTNGTDGDFVEALAYSRVVSAAELSALIAYQKTKWSIP